MKPLVTAGSNTPRVFSFIACVLVSSFFYSYPEYVAAQQLEVTEIDPLFGNGTSSTKSSAPMSPAAFGITKPASTSAEATSLVQVGSTQDTSSEVDIWTQVSELRSRLQAQEYELSSLRKNSSHSMDSSQRDNLPNWFVTYENVLVAPMQQNSTGVIVQTATGYSHVGFPWELTYSPRVQFGSEAARDSLGWRVRFWEFNDSESFTANNANGLIPTGDEGTVGYLSEFGDITTGLAFIEEGTFRSSIRTDVIDVELQRNVAKPLDFYAGLRYAKIVQSYNAVTDQGSANAQSEFRGIGPTVAMRLTHTLPLERLSLFANLRGSMLFGGKSFSVVDDANNVTQSVGDIDLRSGSDSADTLAGNAEVQLGIRYAPADCFNISVAIESQHYANVGGPNPTAVFTGADGGINGDGPIDDSLGFLGLSVGAELRW